MVMIALGLFQIQNGLANRTTSTMETSSKTPKKLLFVCIENSNRSQMAEAFARMLGGEGVEAYSSGSKPSGKVNPKAIAAMRELNYDLSKHLSKPLSDLPPGPYDAVVTMGCGDSCPHIPAKRREDWQIPDPKHLQPAEFNEVRDLIRSKVASLIQSLDD
nr:arsenate reductase ArsC [Pirellula staleyi]